MAQQKVTEEKLLQIMQTELNRNMQRLQNEEVPVYLLSYRIDDQQEHAIASSFGALSSSQKSSKRMLTIQVRVGSKTMDNYRETRKADYTEGNIRFFVSEKRISLDDDSKSIAQTLWLETENVYRMAVKKYEHIKTTASLLVDREDQSPDYSDADKVSYYEPPIDFATLNFNAKQWEDKLKSYTELFVDKKEILSNSGLVSILLQRKYYVNSEGTSIAQNYTAAFLYITAQTQADDGMELPMYKSYFAHTPSGLPDDATVKNDIYQIINKLILMRTAPVVDAFNGPAILSKEAAGVFFHEIFGHRVEGYRMKNESDAQTYKRKVNEEILHPDISVVFDPTINQYRGLPLNGSYQYDDEGVKGQRVLVVDKGVLKNFLMTRTPIENFPTSNGHARASINYQPVSRQSNLIVETARPYTDVELRQLLIEEAKKQGKAYGYRFEQVRGGFTLVGRYFPNSFNVTPIEVYRVYVDGRPDELVRGVDLVGTPLAMFSQIEALGDTHGNFIGTCGAESGMVPVSCCSPALFVKRIETQRKSKNQDIAPILERPYEKDIAPQSDFNSMAFKAMEDEINRNMSLRVDSLQAPYYISYLISDAKITEVSSSLGGLTKSEQLPYKNQTTTVLVGNHTFNNLNFSTNPNVRRSFPVEGDYNALRTSLWATTDECYKKAVQTLESKRTAIEQQNIPEEEKNIPDFTAVPIQTQLLSVEKADVNQQEVEKLANELSKVFENYPEFINSKVNIKVFDANVLYLNSENIKYLQAFGLTKLSVNASIKTAEGEVLNDEFICYGNSYNQLPDKETLKNSILKMIATMQALCKAPAINQSYEGPVMFDQEAVGYIVSEAFFNSSNALISKRKNIESGASSFDVFALLGGENSKINKYEAQIGKEVIDKNISLTAIDKTTMFENTPLIGSYVVDAEGVSVADKLPLIANGILQTLLRDRIPTAQMPQSNAHKRFALNYNELTPSLSPGVVEFTAKKTMSEEKAKKQLLSLAKSKGLEYAYIVRKFANYTDFSGEDIASSVLRMSLGLNTIKPFYIYKVSVKDGSETLVRMAIMSKITMETFKKVAAVASGQQVYNTMLPSEGQGGLGSLFSTGGGVPSSFIVPTAIVLEDVEIKKDQGVILQKPFVTPNPLTE
jgi:predicted Zn-dependent protease